MIDAATGEGVAVEDSLVEALATVFAGAVAAVVEADESLFDATQCRFDSFELRGRVRTN